MDIGSISNSSVNTGYTVYSQSTNKSEEAAGASSVDQAAVYEKSGESKKTTYTINTMSKEDRAALVKQLKSDQKAREQSLMNIVQQTLGQQVKSFGIASGWGDDDSVWSQIANGLMNVDEAAVEQAKKDISEDGYWGITQTSQRLFDFASALAGDDVDTMKEMQKAMQKGYEQATKAWGKTLPDISSKTMEAANKLFEDYYTSKES